MRIDYLQFVLSSVQFVDVGYRETQQAAFLVHSDPIGLPQPVAVTVPLEIRLGVACDAGGEFRWHASVNFAVADPLQERRWLDPLHLSSKHEGCKLYTVHT